MKRVFTMAFVLLFLLFPAFSGMAEAMIPAEVQAFYDMLHARGGLEATAEIVFAENYNDYARHEDISLLPMTISRAQYDRFYYWYMAEDLLVTVAYKDGKPAAYMADSPDILIRAGMTPYMETMLAFVEAYDRLFPAERDEFYFETMLGLPGIRISDAAMGDILTDKMVYDDLLVSVFMQNSMDTISVPVQQDTITVQICPYAAFENGAEGALANHDTTFTLMLEGKLGLLRAIVGEN